MLDYQGLREKVDELAKVEAALMYPLGPRQDEERKRLANKFYRQYITEPQQYCLNK